MASSSNLPVGDVVGRSVRVPLAAGEALYAAGFYGHRLSGWRKRNVRPRPRRPAATTAAAAAAATATTQPRDAVDGGMPFDPMLGYYHDTAGRRFYGTAAGSCAPAQPPPARQMQDLYLLTLAEALHAVLHGKLHVARRRLLLRSGGGDRSGGDGGGSVGGGDSGGGERTEATNSNRALAADSPTPDAPAALLPSLAFSSPPPSTSWLSAEECRRVFGRLDRAFALHWATYTFLKDELGWVPRSGLSLGCDYVAYKGDPDYHHSTYCVTVAELSPRLPCSARWADKERLASGKERRGGAGGKAAAAAAARGGGESREGGGEKKGEGEGEGEGKQDGDGDGGSAGSGCRVTDSSDEIGSGSAVPSSGTSRRPPDRPPDATGVSCPTLGAPPRQPPRQVPRQPPRRPPMTWASLQVLTRGAAAVKKKALVLFPEYAPGRGVEGGDKGGVGGGSGSSTSCNSSTEGGDLPRELRLTGLVFQRTEFR